MGHAAEQRVGRENPEWLLDLTVPIALNCTWKSPMGKSSSDYYRRLEGAGTSLLGTDRKQELLNLH